MDLCKCIAQKQARSCTKPARSCPALACAGKKVSQDLRVTPELTISCDREVFLENEKNK